MLRATCLVLLLFISLTLTAQETWPEYFITCTTQDTAVNAFMPAPADFLNGEAELKTQFDLIFSDDVPAVAQAAMRFAANIWGSYLDSDVPVRVEIAWEDRDNPRLLASAGPGTLFRSFAAGVDPEVWYPVALAEAIAGRELNDPEDADIVVNANSTANWYFATDGNTPRGRIDLASVMLHELGHGLGFLSSVDTINETQLAIGFGDRFIVYDLFIETPAGAPLTDPSIFNSPSEQLLEAVVNNDLVFTGDRAVAENGGDVRLFSPSTFDNGSSVSHLNERSYAPGSENALMTPFLASGEAVHDPGPVTLGIFSDLGWPLDFTVSTLAPVEPQTPLTVFPNPATEVVTVRLPAEVSGGTVVLYGQNGQRVLERVLPAAGGQLDLSVAGLATGMYQLAIVDGRATYGARIMVTE